MTKKNANIVKVKHFVHTEGSGAKSTAIQEFEDFVNSKEVNPIEISHSYESYPHKTLSIFVVYADVELVNNAAKEAVDASEKKAKETKPKAKKTNKGKKSTKSTK